MLGYRIKLTSDDNGTFLATAPDFLELTTFGETREEALGYATSAIEEAIAARIADREDIPAPTADRGHKVAPSAQMALTVKLYQLMRRRNVTKAALARLLGKRPPHIDRLLNVHHRSTVDAMEDAFGALDARVSVNVEETRQVNC